MLLKLSPSDVGTAVRVLARVSDDQAREELLRSEESRWVSRTLRGNRHVGHRGGFQCQACRRLLATHGGLCPGCGFTGGGFTSG